MTEPTEDPRLIRATAFIAAVVILCDAASEPSPLRAKLSLIFDLFDFHTSGDLSLDETTILLLTALLLTVWATQTVTLDEENQVWKASASTCEWDIDDGWINEDGENCVQAMNRWNEVWGRAYRAWIFSAVFVGFAILSFNPKPEASTDTDDNDELASGGNYNAEDVSKKATAGMNMDEAAANLNIEQP